MIEVIKKIVEDEIKKIHIAELGVVTSIFPHSSEGDNDNYECNVKLKYRDLELRRVPVATQHIGLANIPNVGDLVLVTFINGNINAPIVIGRLYTDEDRPPVNKEEEIIYIPPYSKSSSLRRIHLEFPGGIVLSITDDEVSVKAGRTSLKIDRNGDISIESNAKVNLKANQDMSLSANNISIESRGKLEIKSGATAKLEASGTLDIRGALVNIN
jgi:phage baseplate assembly protein gpV